MTFVYGLLVGVYVTVGAVIAVGGYLGAHSELRKRKQDMPLFAVPLFAVAGVMWPLALLQRRTYELPLVLIGAVYLALVAAVVGAVVVLT